MLRIRRWLLFRIIGEGVHALVQGIFDEHALDGMIEDGHATKIQENVLNDNLIGKIGAGTHLTRWTKDTEADIQNYPIYQDVTL